MSRGENVNVQDYDSDDSRDLSQIMSTLTTEYKDRIMELREYVRNNEHDKIVQFVKEHPEMKGDKIFEEMCGCPGCGCVSKVSVKSLLLNLSNVEFEYPVVPETFKLLIDLDIISSKDMEFLGELLHHTNCPKRFDVVENVLQYFDYDAMRNYRSEYNETILTKLCHMYWKPDERERFEKPFRFLIEEVGVDPRIVENENDPKGDMKQSAMSLLIDNYDGYFTRYLHEKFNMDVNENPMHSGRYNMHYLVYAVRETGKWMRKGMKRYGKKDEQTGNYDTDAEWYELPKDEIIEQELKNLYNCLVAAKDCGFDFSVVNVKTDASEKCHSRSKPKPHLYGQTVSSYLRKYRFAEKDPRFEEFY